MSYIDFTIKLQSATKTARFLLGKHFERDMQKIGYLIEFVMKLQKTGPIQSAMFIIQRDPEMPAIWMIKILASCFWVIERQKEAIDQKY